MNIKKIYIIFLLLIFCFGSNIFAETIILESGKIVEAEIIDITGNSIKVNIMGATRRYKLSEIRSIDGEQINISSRYKIKKISNEEEEAVKVKKSEVERIGEQLEQTEKDLKNKRKEYIQAKKELKRAAKPGFLGFGRSKKETEKLLAAKQKLINLKKEYNQIKRDINNLKRELKKAKRKEMENKKKKALKPNNPKPLDSQPLSGQDINKAIKYYNIAVTHQSLGEVSQAKENFRQALQAKPDLGEYFLSKGIKNLNKRRRWEAKRYFERAKKIFQFSQDRLKLKIAEEKLDQIFQ